MEDMNKTNSLQHVENNAEADLTMPGKRDRKPDGRFAVGDLIMNRYKVLSELGQGGMGVVYKCFDETAGIEIALKALPPELSHNTLEMDDIKDNFQLVHNLHHPNIASTNHLERDNANGNYYLIMECCEGEDLRRWLKRKRKEGELKLEDVLPIVKQVADALDYAHKMKIIHRDIKPGNIMINTDGEIKVLDFGLAAQIHTSMTRVSMAYHGTSGTGPYMAPEQWEGRTQNARADQYALAVMVYEMLAGHLPFESTDAAVLREAVLKSNVIPLENIPKAANSAIQRAMSKEPAKRFENCSDFVAALEGKKIKAAKVQKKGGFPKWIAAMIALVLLVGGGTGYYLLSKSPAEKTATMSDSLQLDSLQSLSPKPEPLQPTELPLPTESDSSQSAEKKQLAKIAEEKAEKERLERIAKDEARGFRFSADRRTLLRAPFGIKNYKIPDGVTHIGDRAFVGCKNLSSITIPNSVTHIGDYAFAHCKNLSSIIISNGVTHIGNFAFAECKNLSSITIPNSVTHIGDYVFAECSNLNSITIPNGVTHIGYKAFAECRKLMLEIPASVKNIGYGNVKSVKSFRLHPENKNFSFDNGVLLDTVKKKIVEVPETLSGSYKIPDGVTHIGDHAFQFCTELGSITIPNSVTHIGDRAFQFCRLGSITIPNSVTHIGDKAFYYAGCEAQVKRDYPHLFKQ